MSNPLDDPAAIAALTTLRDLLAEMDVFSDHFGLAEGVGDRFLHECVYCGWAYWGTYLPPPDHTPECLVTRLRAALASPSPPME